MVISQTRSTLDTFGGRPLLKILPSSKKVLLPDTAVSCTPICAEFCRQPLCLLQPLAFVWTHFPNEERAATMALSVLMSLYVSTNEAMAWAKSGLSSFLVMSRNTLFNLSLSCSSPGEMIHEEFKHTCQNILAHQSLFLVLLEFVSTDVLGSVWIIDDATVSHQFSPLRSTEKDFKTLTKLVQLSFPA